MKNKIKKYLIAIIAVAGFIPCDIGAYEYSYNCVKFETQQEFMVKMTVKNDSSNDIKLNPFVELLGGRRLYYESISH